MADVYQGVAVNPAKVAGRQPLFDPPQRLRGQQALFRRHDPNKLAFRLKCQNLVRIEEHVLGSVASDNLAARTRCNRLSRGGNPGGVIGDL